MPRRRRRVLRQPTAECSVPATAVASIAAVAATLTTTTLAIAVTPPAIAVPVPASRRRITGTAVGSAAAVVAARLRLLPRRSLQRQGPANAQMVRPTDRERPAGVRLAAHVRRVVPERQQQQLSALLHGGRERQQSMRPWPAVPVRLAESPTATSAFAASAASWDVDLEPAQRQLLRRMHDQRLGVRSELDEHSHDDVAGHARGVRGTRGRSEQQWRGAARRPVQLIHAVVGKQVPALQPGHRPLWFGDGRQRDGPV